MVLSFFLMFVIMAVATDTRAVGEAAAIAIGGTVGLARWCGGPISGRVDEPGPLARPGDRRRRFASDLGLPARPGRRRGYRGPRLHVHPRGTLLAEEAAGDVVARAVSARRR